MWPETQRDFQIAIDTPASTAFPFIAYAPERFDIYRNNVAVSLIEALSDIFPVIKQLVGDEFFNAMAQTYIQKFRPASPLLFEYGSSFSKFIETFEPAQSLPYLADVARFERLWLDVYHARDAAPIDIQSLQHINENDMDDLILVLHPAFRRFQSDWPVTSIWLAHQKDDAPDLKNINQTPTVTIINRPELDVIVTEITHPMHDFISLVEERRTLGQMCSALEDVVGFNPSEYLAQLFELGGVIDVSIEDTRTGDIK